MPAPLLPGRQRGSKDDLDEILEGSEEAGLASVCQIRIAFDDVAKVGYEAGESEEETNDEMCDPGVSTALPQVPEDEPEKSPEGSDKQSPSSFAIISCRLHASVCAREV